MAARGLSILKVLLVIPILTALLTAGSWWANTHGAATLVQAQPDQQVRLFLEELTSGHPSIAAQRLSRRLTAVDLEALGLRLVQRMGIPVLHDMEIRHWTARSAVVWSRTRTDAGHEYTLRWTLISEDGQWVIRRCDGLEDIAPDIAWQ